MSKKRAKAIKVIIVLAFLAALAITLVLMSGCAEKSDEKEYTQKHYQIFDELKQKWVDCDGYWGWRDAQEWNDVVKKWPRVIVMEVSKHLEVEDWTDLAQKTDAIGVGARQQGWPENEVKE